MLHLYIAQSSYYSFTLRKFHTTIFLQILQTEKVLKSTLLVLFTLKREVVPMASMSVPRAWRRVMRHQYIKFSRKTIKGVGKK
ncbi:MAG: hypothetical protein HW384_2241 [Dehalococcoidia bacterium]|nr:hypothetical protein [Dehalococcoidia bacterium]